ncbi:hypothetical protein SDC9_166176 [bioreactor metagenome]|uniref:Uncharacterized protein n=1 Tax=bioreactor metagenome TaxID=1076179 RepID=A0A645FW96_9ZZZZ
MIGCFVPSKVGSFHHRANLRCIQNLGIICLIQNDADVLLDIRKRFAGVVLSKHANHAAVSLDCVHDEFDRRALARAVLANEA